MTDGDLVRQALDGQTAAREELARVWSPRVLAMCRARIGRNFAEDAAQEALAKAFRELRQISDPERFGGWLRSIAVRVCVDWRRRNRIPGRSTATVEPAVLENLPARNGRLEAARAEQETSLWQAIDELPEELREVLLLFYCDQLPYDSIAEWLEVSRSTVNTRLAKARDFLRQRMTKLTLENGRGVCNRH